MSVLVYSKPNCPQCTKTKNTLKAAGVGFDEIDITEDDNAFMRVTQELGYRQMPVVEAGDQHWSGHDDVMLSALIAAEER